MFTPNKEIMILNSTLQQASSLITQQNPIKPFKLQSTEDHKSICHDDDII